MSQTLTIEEIQSQIKILPEHPPFMLAQDLAALYETEAKYVNRAVKRNSKRFPEDFCFQLTDSEIDKLRCQSGTAISAMARKKPYGFTREGANMLSIVLHTDVAVDRSIQIMRAFSASEQRNFDEIEMLKKAVHELSEKQQESLADSNKTTKDFTKMNERMDVLENQVNAMMKVRGNFNEKHRIFGKFAEIIAEEIDQNRDEIQKLKCEVKNVAKSSQQLLLPLDIEVPPKQEFIDKKQIRLLKDHVKEKGNPRKAWFQLREAFGISSYNFLPKHKFRKALDWLEKNC